MKHLLKKVTKQTDNKFLNIYLAEFEVEGGIKNYQICSRKSQDKIKVLNKEIVPDGVRIMPYFYENGKIKVCFIKEFRYPINDYMYGFPAGLIDDYENPVQSAIRELKEEIGATAIKIEKVDNASFLSAGMSDESLENYEALVMLDSEQNLDFSEDISLEIVDFDNILEFLETHNIGMQTRLQAKAFYYKKLYENLLEKQKVAL